MSALPPAGAEVMVHTTRTPEPAHRPSREQTAFADHFPGRGNDRDLVLAQILTADVGNRPEHVALTTAEILAVAAREVAASLPAELYSVQAFASGRLSYLERNQDSIAVVKNAKAGHVAMDPSISALMNNHGVTGENRSTSSGEDIAAIFAALLAEISEQSEADSDAWVKRVAQAITETFEPWLRRRISINQEGNAVQILVRDYEASDMELELMLRTLTDFSRARFGSSATSIIVNGKAVLQHISTDKENQHAR